MFSLAGALGSLPYMAAVIGLLSLYNALIENPSIRAEARQGMLSVVELSAAKAQLAETQRQAQAALTAGNNLNAVLRDQAAALEKQSAADEQRIADYEAQLKKEGRSCLLSDADVRELRK